MTRLSPAGQSTSHPRRWVILAVLCLALLVVLLDNTVLNVAIPAITDSLGATTAEIQWTINAYSLVLAGLLLTTGSLADRFGRKRALLTGLVLFTGGSAVAALAQTPLQLILARGGMGIGAALLMPSTLAVLMQIFDEKERPKAIAAWSAVASLGFALGPVIGGTLLDHYWWGSVFVLNLPVGALAIIAIALLVPESKAPTSRRADVPGVLLSVVMSVGVVYGIISVPEHGWSSGQVLVPLVTGLVAAAGFITWERRAAEPMLDLALFRNPRFTGAVASNALVAFAMGGSLFLFTQYLQFVLGYSPLEAGFRVMPLAISVLVVTPFSPKISARIGIPATVASGLTVVGAGLLALSFVTSDSGYGPTLLGLVLVGAGVGVAMPTSANALMGAIPRERAGIASGLTSTLQELGTSLGVAILGSVVAARFAAELPSFLPDGVERSVGLALQATGGVPEVVRDVRDAFVSGISMSLLCGSVAAVAAGALAWVLLRREGADRVNG
ncbi:MFS transporter [Amycolatopsis sp. YIM 10]|uniref:MFS transporter n=1 Tax=Amycolatopsis sp. YIM 10 TaxID=2653857 RepID=UPI00128FF9B5|nr:MFS transporter [Amycolatopsis sp. YIM 10]QFU86373.1 Antiseptic resistance protein [Amycolatopsis sp. YIM 10]